MADMDILRFDSAGCRKANTTKKKADCYVKDKEAQKRLRKRTREIVL